MPYRETGFWVEVSALARVRVQVYVKAQSVEEAKEAALKKIAHGEVTHQEWHFEGDDIGHQVEKVRGER